MVSVNATVFRLHMVKRVPKHLWKVKTVELHCTSSAQCALWVDSIKSLLEKRECYQITASQMFSCNNALTLLDFHVRVSRFV